MLRLMINCAKEVQRQERCRNNSLPIPLFVSSFYPFTNGGSLWNPCRMAGWVGVLIVIYNWHTKGFLRKFVLLSPLISFLSFLSSHFCLLLLPNVPSSLSPAQSVSAPLTCPVHPAVAKGSGNSWYVVHYSFPSFWGEELNHAKTI